MTAFPLSGRPRFSPAWLLPILLALALRGGRLEAQSPGTGGAPLTAIQNYRVGRDLEANDRLAEANRYYDETIRLCRDEVSRNIASPDTYTAITWALQRQRKYHEVIAWGEQGLRIFADEYRIMETMGEAYFYLDDYDRSLGCMQLYTNALPQGERISVAYFFIGEIFRLRQQYHRADIAYTTAVRLAPGLALWWYRLASVRELVGDYRPAAEAYRQALRLDPGHRESVTGLARVQERLNEP